MEEVIVALVGGIFSLAAVYLTLWAGRRVGLGATQEKVVQSLKDLVYSQNIQIQNQDVRIKSLETQVKEVENRAFQLGTKVKELTELTVEYALKIKDQDDQLKSNKEKIEILERGGR